jgi:hypothetical protein
MAKQGKIKISSENMMPIIKKWLYSDKDIFLREIVANGIDAITKHKKLVEMGEKPFRATQIFEWLCEHAGQYGFFQPYDNSAERTGYEEERWHWSYKPLSDIYLNAYTYKITPSDLHGFHGSYLVDSLDILQRYVHGIAK